MTVTCEQISEWNALAKKELARISVVRALCDAIPALIGELERVRAEFDEYRKTDRVSETAAKQIAALRAEIAEDEKGMDEDAAEIDRLTRERNDILLRARNSEYNFGIMKEEKNKALTEAASIARRAYIIVHEIKSRLPHGEAVYRYGWYDACLEAMKAILAEWPEADGGPAALNSVVVDAYKRGLLLAAALCEERATAPRGEDDCAAYYGCADAIRAEAEKVKP